VTIRRHPLSGDEILYAPARADRPDVFAGNTICPFCPGNESETPPTIESIGDPWRVRAFANKFPAIDEHEVIVESPDHDDSFDHVAHAEDAVAMYARRVNAHRDAAYVALFKNHGAMAGASIPHLHSQLIPLPFVPPRIEREARAFASTCPLCERVDDALVIAENETFRWFSPHGSTMPYQQWLAPKRHVASIAAMQDNENADLASLLRSSSAAMLRIASAYNWSLIMPGHFYVDAFPRLTTIAGFELGTGTFIEIIDPAATARLMRI